MSRVSLLPIYVAIMQMTSYFVEVKVKSGSWPGVFTVLLLGLLLPSGMWDKCAQSIVA